MCVCVYVWCVCVFAHTHIYTFTHTHTHTHTRMHIACRCISHCICVCVEGYICRDKRGTLGVGLVFHLLWDRVASCSLLLVPGWLACRFPCCAMELWAHYRFMWVLRIWTQVQVLPGALLLRHRSSKGWFWAPGQQSLHWLLQCPAQQRGVMTLHWKAVTCCHLISVSVI